MKTNFEQIAEIAQNTEYSYQFNDSTLQILELLPIADIRESIIDVLPTKIMDILESHFVEKQEIRDSIIAELDFDTLLEMLAEKIECSNSWQAKQLASELQKVSNRFNESED